MDPTSAFVKEATDGLRAFADFIEANPHLPWSKTYNPAWEVYLQAAEDAAAFAASAGGWDKRPAGQNQELLDLHRTFGPLTLRVIIRRDEVCERQVVGTETVEVADPNAPKVTVEREVVEWKCRPLLASEVG